MGLCELVDAARSVVPGITPAELAVVATAWARIYLDGEDEAATITWARHMVGSEPTSDELRDLQAQGMSIREIARTHGMSKSNVARRLSQRTAA